ncbi:helix-turn-helix domain-containing protein [Pannonibacter tanglangensis]|uniref:Helix-turn-helix domain-containing protein n=1 Tax=Pannonibacter tanglangensis TaxID=2750084 RepID=A0ABW9ZD90_9HYPH|nr:helix-turn-helix domain-containing protein [Pannonibacter sp. XCT-34]
MNLKQWRLTQGKTLGDCARHFGLKSARTYQRYETGENRPDADLVDAFVRLSGGAVTALDMHQTRLEWLRMNHPEKFSCLPVAACAAPGPVPHPG